MEGSPQKSERIVTLKPIGLSTTLKVGPEWSLIMTGN